jgi:uncharacterized membrane protein YqjE
VTARPIVTDPDIGIPDLIRRLTEDSKRLVTDEVQLAKIETKENLHRATRGAIWMALSFGIGVVALTALTIFLATLVGRLAGGHMWVGAIVTGVVELMAGLLLLKRGLGVFHESSYTLEETRHTLTDTAHWAGSVRQD